MKKICIIIACTFLLLACNKEKIDNTSTENTTNAQQNTEAVNQEPKSSLYDITPPLNLQGYAKDGAPIILVHGFLGFGRDEAFGFKYWGGFSDLQEILKANGYPTFTASVGPISSNYDRAIELYYQIKGGCVDYGKSHSNSFGHYQKVNKCYPGFYPQWDANHPVHLIGHSMGGQTVRALISLLEKGMPAEISDPQHASLFNGNRIGWVKSATTISSPNNGTTLASVLTDYMDYIKKGVATVASFTNNTPFSIVYNFDLEQWGLTRNPGESQENYCNRVFNYSTFKYTKDLSSWDLSPEGARELNNWVKTSPSVYYFSISNRASNTGLITGWEYPQLTMNPLFVPLAAPYAWPFSPGIGNFTQDVPGKVYIDYTWWKNDGVVNVISMNGPTGSTNIPYIGQNPSKGKWYNMPLINGYDHMDMIGMSLWGDISPLYLGQAALVSSLP